MAKRGKSPIRDIEIRTLGKDVLVTFIRFEKEVQRKNGTTDYVGFRCHSYGHNCNENGRGERRLWRGVDALRHLHHSQTGK